MDRLDGEEDDVGAVVAVVEVQAGGHRYQAAGADHKGSITGPKLEERLCSQTGGDGAVRGAATSGKERRGVCVYVVSGWREGENKKCGPHQ